MHFLPNPKCASSSSSPSHLLLLVAAPAAAATVVADRSLPLRPPSSTHHRPPPPRPRPHFPGFSGRFLKWASSSPSRPLLLAAAAAIAVADRSLPLQSPSSIQTAPSLPRFFPMFPEVLLFLSRLPSSSGRRRHRCGRLEPSSPTTVPDPSPSSSSRTAPSLTQFFLTFPKVHLFIFWLPSSSGRRRHRCGQSDPSFPTTIPDPSSSSSAWTTPSLPQFFPMFPEVHLFLSRPPTSSGRRRRHRCGRPDLSSPTTVPNPSSSPSSRTAPSIPWFFPMFPEVHLFLSLPPSSSSHRHNHGRSDPSSLTTVP